MSINKLLLIGASTGGPGRIHAILSSLDPAFEGSIVIAQHMASPFIPSFIKQLQSNTLLSIHEVGDGIRMENGHIYVCSVTSRLIGKHGGIWIEPTGEDDYPYNPEINTLFHSASYLDSAIRRLGVILTGIGEDGAKGALSLYLSGGECYFENEESATVYGMPRRAKELVEQAKTGSMDDIINAIKNFGVSHVRMV